MNRILLVLSVLLAGCASPIVWRERQATEAKHLVPTCWNCGAVVEWESEECIREECGVKYRWVDRPGEED